VVAEEQTVPSALVARMSGSLALRLLVTALALMIWFWTQKSIGARGAPGLTILDRVHEITHTANSYLQVHPLAADVLLIVSSAIIDLLGIFLLAKWIFGASIRPFLGLVMVLGLRQIMQSLTGLPTPPNAIWHYPGFPSLLVTYSVSNDYFFSGHTAIAVLAAAEISRMHKPWLTAIAIAIVLFEVASVLVLRAHYTMDVFSGLVTGLYAAHLANCLAPNPAAKS
jgi:hypothetical protein